MREKFAADCPHRQQIRWPPTKNEVQNFYHAGPERGYLGIELIRTLID